MIKYIFFFSYILIIFEILTKIIPRKPKESNAENKGQKYFCPICDTQCSYLPYDDTNNNDDTNMIFELKCYRYCRHCGTRLNYKYVNDKHICVKTKDLHNKEIRKS